MARTPTHTINIHGRRTGVLVKALFVVAIAAAVVAAVAPTADASTTIATSALKGVTPGALTPLNSLFPNTCRQGSTDLTLAAFKVDKASGTYAGYSQNVYVWAQVLRSTGTTWQADTWADGSTWGLMNSQTFYSYNPSLTVYPGVVSGLAPGYWSVRLHFAWWVDGVGYIASKTVAMNNDPYIRQFASPYGGEYLNTGASSTTSYGFCYVG